MNREEAQFILSAYRPGTEDDHDPQFQAALDLVRQDQDLARWFVQQQAVDAAFARQLRSALPVPPDLKEYLLLARRTVLPSPWWRRPAWLAAAASLALLLGSGWGYVRHTQTQRFADFRSTVEPAVMDMVTHNDVMGLDQDQLKSWLAAQQGHADYVLPSRLAGVGVAGCKVLNWQGHKVTLLCFKTGGKHADVFVVDAAELPGTAAGPVPVYAVHDGFTTALWRHEGKIYYLAGNISQYDLERLL